MVFDTPGKITDRIWLVGRRESCAYIVGGGQDYALLGGAMAYVTPDVLEQLNRFGIDEDKIHRIVFLHSHFDHCGLVPLLREITHILHRAVDGRFQPDLFHTFAYDCSDRYSLPSEDRPLAVRFTADYRDFLEGSLCHQHCMLIND